MSTAQRIEAARQEYWTCQTATAPTPPTHMGPVTFLCGFIGWLGAPHLDAHLALALESAVADALREALEECIAIARGCEDYSGGFHGDEKLLAAYHAGIQTVGTALAGPDDTQRRTLETIGSEALALAAAGRIE